MIPDLLTSAISIQKVSFKSVIAVHHCAQLFHFSTENIISKHVFTLKSLLERLKRDFDGSKIVSFQSTSKL